MTWKNIINKDFYVLSAIYVVLIAFIYPFGNFVLNDGFSYAQQTLRNFNDSRFEIHSWHAITFLTQEFTSYPFLAILGSHFDALRLGVIAQSFVLLFVALQLFKGKHSIWMVAMLLFSPLFLQLGMSYMTEIPFLLWIAIAIFALEKWLSTSLKKWFYIYLVSTIAAVLLRQNAILLPICVSAFLFLFKRSDGHLLHMNTIISIAVFLLYSKIAIDPEIHKNYGTQIHSLSYILINPSLDAVKTFVYNFNNALLALSIFVSPLAIAMLKRNVIKKHIMSISIILIPVIAVNLYKIFILNNYLFFSGTSFYSWGIGPIIINDFQSYLEPHSHIDLFIWSILNCVAIISLLSILSHMLNGIQWNKTLLNWILLSFTLLNIVLPSFVYFNDRYIVVPLFCIAIVLYQINGTLKNVVFIAGTIILTSFSILVNYNYFSFHRSKSELVGRNLNRVLDLKTLDAGFEWNAYHNYNFEHYLKSPQNKWWWVYDEQFVLSSKIQEGYIAIDSINNQQLFGHKQLNVLYFLERE